MLEVRDAGGPVASVDNKGVLAGLRLILGGLGILVDTGLSRLSPGRVAIGNGAQGDYSGTLTAAHVQGIATLQLLNTTFQYQAMTAPDSTGTWAFSGANATSGSGGKLSMDSLKATGLQVFLSNTLALGGGLVAGEFYRTGLDPDVVCVVH
jgi:hypothetical protein